ncbi:hypothetical protein BU16DRAFT_566192 [Lophium mytilinum]|uniref:F-box domain-containing protein n=1 Tax=Lophium mytilinum TaxID=390894 RepID=A0A6A6QDN8_9PEZI|nr:hypothetical protein BU16DRAFT_566192 [Lophium mytilinum]
MRRRHIIRSPGHAAITDAAIIAAGSLEVVEGKEHANRTPFTPVTTMSSSNDSFEPTALRTKPSDALLTTTNPTTKLHGRVQDTATGEQEDEDVERPDSNAENLEHEMRSHLDQVTTQLEETHVMPVQGTLYNLTAEDPLLAPTEASVYSETNGVNYIDRLPTELLHSICEYLPPGTIGHLRGMNKRFAAIGAEYHFPKIVVPFDKREDSWKQSVRDHCFGDGGFFSPAYAEEFINTFNSQWKKPHTRDLDVIVRIYMDDPGYSHKTKLKSDMQFRTNSESLFKGMVEDYREIVEWEELNSETWCFVVQNEIENLLFPNLKEVSIDWAGDH